MNWKVLLIFPIYYLFNAIAAFTAAIIMRKRFGWAVKYALAWPLIYKTMG